MAAPTTPAEAIEQAALGPASVTVDGTAVVAPDIDKLIKADQHLAGKEAAASNRPGFGLRFQKITPTYQ